MLASEKIFVKNALVKEVSVENGFSSFDYVKSLVRNTEYRNLIAKKTWVNGKKALENAHPGIDVLTCEETIINQVLKNDAGQFIKNRDEVVELKAEIETLLPMDKITSLCTTDRVHITLMAHAVYKKVQLDDSIFDVENGGVDISKVIAKYYANGSLSELKNTLRPIFNKLLGTEGDNFYAIGIKKSDFSGSDLRNFVASFGGNAKRKQITTKVDGKKITKIENFNYVDKSSNREIQIAAFTTLCAVVLDNANKHEVLKLDDVEKM